MRTDSAVVQVNGVKAFGWFAFRPVNFRQFQTRRDCPDYAGGDLILELKNVIQRSVEPIGPQMGSGSGIDELADEARCGRVILSY